LTSENIARKIDYYCRERNNEPALCVALGMDAEMVDLRFKAIQNLETELGIVGKTPIMHSIFLLINNIEVHNQFGAVNNEIQVLEDTNYSHLSMKMTRGSMTSILARLDAMLNEEDLSDLFMHGTKAAIPRGIVDKDMPLRISGTGGDPHDFGPGLYCFRDHGIAAALSFAV
jgi:hypothetical protein